MDVFTNLQQTTFCPFAAQATVEHGPAWVNDLPFEANVARNAERLKVHLAVGRVRRLQGFVSQVGFGLGNSVDFERTVEIFRRFVFGLGDFDSSCRGSLTQDIGSVGWSLKFADEPVFLNLFAPCYPERHSKHVAYDGCLYIFFQPEYTFDFCNVNRTRVELKAQIREKFADAGMPYDGATIDTRRKALSFVFPIRTGDPPVRWWEMFNPDPADEPHRARCEGCRRSRQSHAVQSARSRPKGNAAIQGLGALGSRTRRGSVRPAESGLDSRPERSSDHAG